MSSGWTCEEDEDGNIFVVYDGELVAEIIGNYPEPSLSIGQTMARALENYSAMRSALSELYTLGKQESIEDGELEHAQDKARAALMAYSK